MTGLAEFLLARYAEDEEAAPWLHDSLDCESAGGSRDCTCGVPARVLAKCAADRRIVDREARPFAPPRLGPSPDYYPIEQPETDTLRLLALPYADHPDYREEWRP